jgi:hypothetical protein
MEQPLGACQPENFDSPFVYRVKKIVLPEVKRRRRA